jgi:hypothetical protein
MTRKTITTRALPSGPIARTKTMLARHPRSRRSYLMTRTQMRKTRKTRSHPFQRCAKRLFSRSRDTHSRGRWKTLQGMRASPRSALFPALSEDASCLFARKCRCRHHYHPLLQPLGRHRPRAAADRCPQAHGRSFSRKSTEMSTQICLCSI